jgi:hypothetical protein
MRLTFPNGILVARCGDPNKEQTMVIHFVRIKTPLAQEEVRRIMEERAPRFREVPGLLQKYYGYEPSSGAFCGCYIFDSEEARQAFAQSELARTIPAAYEAEEVCVEAYEVLFPLYEEAPRLARQARHT